MVQAFVAFTYALLLDTIACLPCRFSCTVKKEEFMYIAIMYRERACIVTVRLPATHFASEIETRDLSLIPLPSYLQL